MLLLYHWRKPSVFVTQKLWECGSTTPILGPVVSCKLKSIGEIFDNERKDWCLK